jgi:hyperosmotically inducible periplasmic protein
MTMLRILTAAALTLVLSAPAVAADSTRSTSSGSSRAQSTGENLQLFRAVQKQVLQYSHFTIFDNVNVQVDNGAVKLTGKVTMPYKIDDIENRVRKVAGVQRVDNRLEVLPVSQFDDELRVGIAHAIYSNPAFRQFATMVNPPIHIIVDRGHVTLDGVVLNEVDRAIARSIASGFLAFSVKNELKTEAEVQQELEKL